MSKGYKKLELCEISLSIILQKFTPERKKEKMKLKKGKDMNRKIRKGKEGRAGRPLSVSGQGDVTIILQRQISSKQFPPANGDQGAYENRDMQYIC